MAEKGDLSFLEGKGIDRNGPAAIKKQIDNCDYGSTSTPPVKAETIDELHSLQMKKSEKRQKLPQLQSISQEAMRKSGTIKAARVRRSLSAPTLSICASGSTLQFSSPRFYRAPRVLDEQAIKHEHGQPISRGRKAIISCGCGIGSSNRVMDEHTPSVNMKREVDLNSLSKSFGMGKEVSNNSVATAIGNMGLSDSKRLVQYQQNYNVSINQFLHWNERFTEALGTTILGVIEMKKLLQEFKESFGPIYEQLISFIEKLKHYQTDISRSMESVDAFKNVSKFVTSFVTGGSIFLSSMALPHIAAALATAASLPVGTWMTWMDERCNRDKSGLKKEKDIIVAMEKNMTDLIKSMHEIWACVSDDISSMVHLGLQEKKDLLNKVLGDVHFQVVEGMTLLENVMKNTSN